MRRIVFLAALCAASFAGTTMASAREGPPPRELSVASPVTVADVQAQAAVELAQVKAEAPRYRRSVVIAPVAVQPLATATPRAAPTSILPVGFEHPS